MWDAFQRFGGTQRAWADEINVAESQIGKYFRGDDLPRYEVALRIATLDRVPAREVEAYRRVADGRASFADQESNSLDESALLECSRETLLISRHASFATAHPIYSRLIRQLVQSGARYTVVVPEGEVARRLVFDIMARCIDTEADQCTPIRTIVYTVDPARLQRVLDDEVSEIAVYSPREQRHRVAIQAGQVHGPGIDWLLEHKHARIVVERAWDAIRKPTSVWNASSLREVLRAGAKPRR
ncbi:helix-turn-helix transcriptional regulator [Sorangium sp. So ce136]|uniref:helix-turn-helix domain-containing protein n=1 Tax=Sorangium sp. So ce136 TaxID=3133284 RepID=UPI003F06D744